MFNKKSDSLPSRALVVLYLTLACTLSLFILTTVLWIAGGWQGLVTIPLILANWLSVAMLSISFIQLGTNNDL